ncbi:MAG: VanZ family protein [Fibrobacterota bacterium]
MRILKDYLRPWLPFFITIIIILLTAGAVPSLRKKISNSWAELRMSTIRRKALSSEEAAAKLKEKYGEDYKYIIEPEKAPSYHMPHLKHRLGKEVYDLAYIIAAVAVFYGFYSMWRQRHSVSPLSALFILGTGFLYIYSFMHIRHPVERVHFIEYGALAVFAWQGVRKYTGSAIVPLWAAALCWAAGLGDEFVQHLLINRVGEFRDVMINVYACVLALVIMIFFSGFLRTANKPGRKEYAAFTAALIVLLSLNALFIKKVHNFGHAFTDSKIGRIYSFFTKEDLLKTDSLVIIAPAQLSRETLRRYNNEGGRHLFVRNDNLKEGRWFACHRESMLMDKYYGSYLIKEEAVWPDSLKASIKKKGASRKNAVFESRVQSLLITNFNEGLFWGIYFFLLTSGVLIFYFLVRKTKLFVKGRK